MLHFDFNASIFASTSIANPNGRLKWLCRELPRALGLCMACLLSLAVAQCSGSSIVEFQVSTMGDLTFCNGGLDRPSKRDIYARLLGQRSDMASMPYGVQNERDLRGADMANDMAARNADRGLDRQKFSWDREKFGIDRADRIAAANAPMSEQDRIDLAIKN